MPYSLNKKLSGLEPYDPGIGNYQVRLDANESFIKLPDGIVDEILAEIKTVDFNRYPDPTAAELCKAFAEYYGIDADSVTAGNGSDELLYIISTCFSMAGEAIATTAPDFSMYRFYGHLAECRNVVYNKTALETDPDDLIRFCNENKAKILFFSNPCNPTGRGLCRSDVIKIISGVDALVVLDEAYMDFWDQSLIKDATQFDNLILLKTMSKAVGAAAARLGFAVANKTLTTALRAAKSPYNVGSLPQAAGTVILRHGDYLKKSAEEIMRSRERLYAAFLPFCTAAGWRIKESAANFLFIEFDGARDFYDYLKGHGIHIRCFDGAVRISAGSDAENEAVIKAAEDYISCAK